MTDKYDGGYVHPLAFEDVSKDNYVQYGITLRNHYAGLAMQALIINPHGLNNDSWDDLVAGSYQMADMMIAGGSK